MVQLLNPWLQIESPMDSPGISIENPSNITYLLLVSFFGGGGKFNHLDESFFSKKFLASVIQVSAESIQ